MSNSPKDTARHHRLHGYMIPADPAKAGGIVLLQDGHACQGISIEGQKVTFDFSKPNSLYPDDAVALLRDIYRALQVASPRPRNATVIAHLNEAIYEADRAAVERHGYSNSEAERNVPVPYSN